MTTAAPHRFPMQRQCPYSPPPEYAELRSTDPISKVELYDGRWAWLLTRHADVRNVLKDPRVSAVPTRADFPFLNPQDKAVKSGDRSFQRLDAPEHTRIRRMLAPHFTPKAAQKMRAEIETIVQDQLDRLLAKGGPVDLVAEFALVVPSSVTCNMLGIPYSDHDFFQRHSTVRVSRTAAPEQIVESTQALLAYFGELIAARQAEPRDDLLTFLGSRVSAEELTLDEALMAANLILLAGHETTANMIALGTLLLLENPDQLERLTSGAVSPEESADELLRYAAISQSAVVRQATEDIEISGYTIRAGDGVIAAVTAANWDPEMFENPEQLDLSRPEARQHQTFGGGVHLCLGQSLARLELAVVFERLFRTFPTLHSVVPRDELRFKTDSVFYGLHEFSINW